VPHVLMQASCGADLHFCFVAMLYYNGSVYYFCQKDGVGLHPFLTSETSGPVQEIRNMICRSRTHTISLRILDQDNLVAVKIVILRAGIFH